MRHHFPKQNESFGADINVKVNLSNYATKVYLKNEQELIHLNLAAKSDLVSLKVEVDKLDIVKLKSVPTNLSNLKSKVDNLDIGKLETTPIDLSKLSNLVKNDVVKNTKYNAKIRTIKYNTNLVPDYTNLIPDITNLPTKTTFNSKKNEVKVDITSITNLGSTTALTAVENKINT